MTIQALIFDYDGVLTASADRAAFYTTAEQTLGFAPGELYHRLWDSDGWQQVKRGRISDAVFWRAMLPTLGLDAADYPYGPLAFLIEEQIDLRMVNLLRRLRPYYQLAMLSNATLGYETRWQAFGLYDLFDVVINSATVGLAKPDPEIYNLTLARLDRQPDECLFVDDKPRNTLAAEALGISSIVFTTYEALVDTLRECRIL